MSMEGKISFLTISFLISSRIYHHHLLINGKMTRFEAYVLLCARSKFNNYKKKKKSECCDFLHVINFLK